jgi:hypothetical protein
VWGKGEGGGVRGGGDGDLLFRKLELETVAPENISEGENEWME